MVTTAANYNNKTADHVDDATNAITSVVHRQQRHHLHALATAIRSCAESDAYDFGGLPASTIVQVIKDAFSTPLIVAEEPPNKKTMTMIRITIIVGGGKQSRQKYDPLCLKLVTSTLQSIGNSSSSSSSSGNSGSGSVLQYVEDKGASCIMDCAGSYKVQHDTGKNVKTVVIFPHMMSSSSSSSSTTTNGDPNGGKSNISSSSSSSSSSSKNNQSTVGGIAASTLLSSSSTALLPHDSIQYTVATCSMAVFTNMVKFRFPHWGPKRTLLQVMEDTIIRPLQDCDKDLIQGAPLSGDKQLFYDMCIHIDNKKTFLKEQIHQHIVNGTLTQIEVTILLSQIQSRIDDPSTTDSKKALDERKKKLQTTVPIPLPPLKHHSALCGLWKQVAPLLYLNTATTTTSGKLLSIQETKKLGQMNDLLQQINELEQDSKQWFEDDDTYTARIKSYRQELQQKIGGTKLLSTTTSTNHNDSNNDKKRNKIESTTTKGPGGKTINATTRIHVPTFGGKGWMSSDQKKDLALKKKKARMVKGDVFGAMMVDDDDSDDDNDDDNADDDDHSQDDDEMLQQRRNASVGTETSNIIDAAGSVPTKKKKNKKKSKTKGNSNYNDCDDDDAVLSKAYAESMAAAKSIVKVEEDKAQKEQQMTAAITATMSFVHMYMLPFLMGILSWIGSILFGTAKLNKKSTNSNKKKM
jgi:hypothetical protein